MYTCSMRLEKPTAHACMCVTSTFISFYTSAIKTRDSKHMPLYYDTMPLGMQQNHEDHALHLQLEYVAGFGKPLHMESFVKIKFDVKSIQYFKHADTIKICTK